MTRLTSRYREVKYLFCLYNFPFQIYHFLIRQRVGMCCVYVCVSWSLYSGEEGNGFLREAFPYLLSLLFLFVSPLPTFWVYLFTVYISPTSMSSMKVGTGSCSSLYIWYLEWSTVVPGLEQYLVSVNIILWWYLEFSTPYRMLF